MPPIRFAPLPASAYKREDTPPARTPPISSAAGVADALTPLPPRPDGLGGSDDRRSLEEKRLRHLLCRQMAFGPERTVLADQAGLRRQCGRLFQGGPYGGKKYFSPYGNPRLSDGPDGEHLPDRLASETCDSSRKTKANRSLPCFRSTRSTHR